MHEIQPIQIFVKVLQREKERRRENFNIMTDSIINERQTYFLAIALPKLPKCPFIPRGYGCRVGFCLSRPNLVLGGVQPSSVKHFCCKENTNREKKIQFQNGDR